MPGDSATPNGVQAAAAYLRELLLRPGRYRRRWEQYAERSRLGQVNQLAVAEVLAHYLWEHPRAQGDVDVLPRQLKDTASRALSGKLLSKATLTLFTDAFGFDAFERERLQRLWEGSAHVRVLSGPRAIRVQFHPGKLPGSVVWAVWDGMDGPIIDRENVALDSQFAVHRYLRLAETTVVGFHWDW